MHYDASAMHTVSTAICRANGPGTQLPARGTGRGGREKPTARGDTTPGTGAAGIEPDRLQFCARGLDQWGWLSGVTGRQPVQLHCRRADAHTAFSDNEDFNYTGALGLTIWSRRCGATAAAKAG